ncbi:hypothetical protein T11_10686 [Trichinella zimbabwensis]|uniref:Uncharacterized protein n=1 Tax=Trichinella zimbabwensis TaxID=268475 RepID=A0A0V1GL03_9BILA|nr:hypothetical protein T11_10686 [Trichinella zimbabwensis]
MGSRILAVFPPFVYHLYDHLHRISFKCCDALHYASWKEISIMLRGRNLRRLFLYLINACESDTENKYKKQFKRKPASKNKNSNV